MVAEAHMLSSLSVRFSSLICAERQEWKSGGRVQIQHWREAPEKFIALQYCRQENLPRTGSPSVPKEARLHIYRCVKKSMIFIDVEEEDRREPWSHGNSSLKISKGKKIPCRGCLTCGLEPCDSIWVDRESQMTESTIDINTRKGRLMSSAGPSKDGSWPLVWGTRIQESLRGFQTYRRHTLHSSWARSTLECTNKAKLNMN